MLFFRNALQMLADFAFGHDYNPVFAKVNPCFEKKAYLMLNCLIIMFFKNIIEL